MAFPEVRFLCLGLALSGRGVKNTTGRQTHPLFRVRFLRLVESKKKPEVLRNTHTVRHLPLERISHRVVDSPYSSLPSRWERQPGKMSERD